MDRKKDKKEKKVKELPRTIYACKSKYDDTSGYLGANSDLNKLVMGQDDLVGEYRLVHQGKVKVEFKD